MGTIPSYGAPVRPLDGTEEVAAWQDGQQVAPTTGQVADYVMTRAGPAIDESNAALQAEIDALHATVAAIPPSVFALVISGFAASPAIVEVGTSVSSIALAWTLNKAVTGQTVSGAAVDAAARAVTKSGPFTSNQVFPLVATDGANTATAAANLTFLNKGHVGTINKSDGSTLTSADVNGMSQSWFADAVSRTLSFTTTADGYVWYSQPASQADPTTFKLGGFTATPAKTTRSHTTATGQAVSYNDFRLSDITSAGTPVVLEVIA